MGIRFPGGRAYASQKPGDLSWETRRNLRLMSLHRILLVAGRSTRLPQSVSLRGDPWASSNPAPCCRVRRNHPECPAGKRLRELPAPLEGLHPCPSHNIQITERPFHGRKSWSDAPPPLRRTERTAPPSGWLPCPVGRTRQLGRLRRDRRRLERRELPALRPPHPHAQVPHLRPRCRSSRKRWPSIQPR